MSKSKHQARFSMIQRRAVLDPDLPGTAFKVLAIIGLYLNEDREAWPKQQTIAEVGAMSRSTVIRALKVLESAGYIESRKARPNQPGTHKCYRVALDDTSGSVSNEHPNGHCASSPESVKIDTPGSVRIETSDKHCPSGGGSVKNETSGSVTDGTSGSCTAVTHPIGTSPTELNNADALFARDAPKRAAAPRGAARGCRLPESWSPSPADYAFAAKQGFGREEINFERDKFKDHWAGKTGRGATKRDWSAAWRNWIRTSVQWGSARRANGRAGPLSESAFERLDRRLAEAETGHVASEPDDMFAGEGFIIEAGGAGGAW